jgi:hypothetical protein
MAVCNPTVHEGNLEHVLTTLLPVGLALTAGRTASVVPAHQLDIHSKTLDRD